MTTTSAILPADSHNLRLAANVRPSSWVNPVPAARYDLVVIGAGTAGLVTAAGAAGLGARVALIERHLMGGDCLNYGCVPSKALLRAARGVGEVARAQALGVSAARPKVDFVAVMERMRRLRADLSGHDSAARFSALGIDLFFGTARFTDARAIEVGGARLSFRRAAIATGARAASLPVAGLEQAGYLTNESVFSLTQLPQRMAIIGGGAVGCELAQAFARFGTGITILEATPQILGRDDRDAARIVEGALKRDGVRIFTSCNLTGVEQERTHKTLHFTVNGAANQLATDEILLGVGRSPNVEGLQLEAAGIEFDQRGIKVDDRLRTSNKRVYAAGDICTGLKFTHMADAMARIVIRNALFFGHARVSHLTVPSCTYTDPEIAQLGFTEDEARAHGLRVRAFVQSLTDVDRAVLDGESEGFIKLLTVERGDRIVGATAVASHSGEMISEIALAMSAGIGLRKLAGVIHPYPTQAAAFRQAADAYNRSRLTPRAKRMLTRWFTLTR